MAESPLDPFAAASRPIIQSLLLRSATRDLETGCLKDCYFAERAAEEIARRKRYGGRLSLLLVAPEPPASTEEEAKKQLAELARLLLARVRSTDLVGRWEKEELLVLLPNTGLAGAVRLARRILLTAATTAENEAARKPSLSIGVATWLGAEEGLATLLARARAGLAEARARGGGCFGVS